MVCFFFFNIVTVFTHLENILDIAFQGTNQEKKHKKISKLDFQFLFLSLTVEMLHFTHTFDIYSVLIIDCGVFSIEK